jgi:hypothetical protein
VPMRHEYCRSVVACDDPQKDEMRSIADQLCLFGVKPFTASDGSVRDRRS